MTKDQRATLEQVAREYFLEIDGYFPVKQQSIDRLVTLLAAQRAKGLEEVVKVGQDFINTVYPNSPSHAKGATEILELLRQQAQEQRP